MRLVWYQNFRQDLQIIDSCKPSSTTIPAATPNNASISVRAISDPLKHLASINIIVNIKVFVSVGLQRYRLGQS